MALLVIVITNGPAYVLIFPTRWLVASTIILSRNLDCVDLNGRNRALRPKAAEAAIATIPIVPILLIVPARSLQGLNLLGTIKRHSLCLLGAEQKGVLVSGVIFNGF